MNFFYFLAPVLGIAMRWLYMLVQNYGWTIIIFTVLIRALMLPLSLKQQKSQARTSAYQPMIQEIQKKWANDKNKQSQEMQKFYEENNIKMTAGCLPMVVNMLVIFGIIGVIQAPLDYILQIEKDQISNGVEIVQNYMPESNIRQDTYTQQSILIGEVKQDPQLFIEGETITFEAQKDGDRDGEHHIAMNEGDVEKIKNFDFKFMGLNMAAAPTTKDWVTLIMPILSILTMFASQFIIMKTSGTSGNQGRTQMLIMTVVMGVMFGFFAFRVPVGFSLYYTVSNVVMTLQQLVLKKIYDPEKIRAEVEAEIEEKRAAKKAKKKLVVQAEDGQEVRLEVTESELVKMRLAKARELDAQRYGDAEPESEEEKQALENARKKDAEKDNASAAAAGKKPQDIILEDSEPSPEEEGQSAEEATESAAAKAEYKPGRRKRARQNKGQDGEDSFAQREKEVEDKDAQKEAD